MTLDGMLIDHPRYLYVPKVLRHWYGHFYRFSVRKVFARALEEFRPDIVFAPWAYPDGWAAVHLGHAAGLPVVVKVHGSDIRVLTRVRGRRRRTAEAVCFTGLRCRRGASRGLHGQVIAMVSVAPL